MPQNGWSYSPPPTPGTGRRPAQPAEAGAWTFDTPEQAAKGDSRWGDYAGMVTRGIGGFLGNAGGPLGALAGGGSDLLAQILERVGGSREDISLGETAVNAGLGFIPFGKAASTVRGLAKASTMGAGNAAALDLINQSEHGDEQGLDLGRTLSAAGTGALWGLGGGGAAAGVTKLLSKSKAPAGGRPTRAELRAEADAAGPPNPRARGPMPPADAPPLDHLLFKTMMELSDEADRAGAPGPRARGPVPSEEPLSVFGMGVERNNPLEGLETSRNRGMGTQTDVKGVKRIPSNDGWTYSGSNREIAPAEPMPYSIDVEPPPSRGLLSFLDPEEGLQNNASGHTMGSTEALNRASSLSRDGVQQFRVGRDGSRQLQIDPSQIADPWTTIGAGERVERVWPDGRVEIVAGDAPTARLNAAGPEIEALRTPEAGEVNLGTGDGPIDLDAILAAGERPRKPFVPAEHVVAHREIMKRQAEKPGSGNTSGDLVGSSVQWQKTTPERLWNLERKATKAARARTGDRLLPIAFDETPRNPTTVDQLHPNWPKTPGDGADLTGESGAIDPELLTKLAFHLGGAATGATAAGVLSDDDTRLRNMIGAGLAGGIAPLAVTNPQALQRIRYASLLGSGSPQIKNLLGGVSNTAVRAGENLLTGDVQGAKDLLSGVFDPEILTRFRDAFQDAGTATPRTMDAGRWGTTQGILGLPSRVMHAADEAFTGGLQRGGLTEDDARTVLMTNQPRSLTGQKVAELAHIPTISTVVPFARTAMNMLERGLEHTPGIGSLPAVAKMRPESTFGQRMARQGMGAAALGAGAVASEYLPDSVEPYAVAGMGPLALPYLFGAAGKEAYERRGDPFSNVARSPIDVLRDAMALPTDPYDWDLGRYMASYVPGVVRDASLADPRSFSTSRSIFDPTISKIPMLNEAVLPRKARRAVQR